MPPSTSSRREPEGRGTKIPKKIPNFNEIIPDETHLSTRSRPMGDPHSVRCCWLAARDSSTRPVRQKSRVLRRQSLSAAGRFRYLSVSHLGFTRSRHTDTRPAHEERAGTGARASTRVSSSGNSHTAPAFALLGAERSQTHARLFRGVSSSHRRGCFPAASSRPRRPRPRTRLARCSRPRRSDFSSRTRPPSAPAR